MHNVLLYQVHLTGEETRKANALFGHVFEVSDLWYQNHADAMYARSNRAAAEAKAAVDLGERQRLETLSRELWKIAAKLEACGRLVT